LAMPPLLPSCRWSATMTARSSCVSGGNGEDFLASNLLSLYCCPFGQLYDVDGAGGFLADAEAVELANKPAWARLTHNRLPRTKSPKTENCTSDDNCTNELNGKSLGRRCAL
jgi:hypothetical protein